MQSDYVLSAAAPTHSASAIHVTSDENLIREIAKGDKRAMRVLYARHNVRVYRFIARLVGDNATAEDLVSEVFLDVWRQAAQFEGRSQASTWLLAIARYKALSQLRSRPVECLDDQVLIISCGEKDDGDSFPPRLRLDAAAGHKPISLRHHDVQKD